MRFLIIYTGKYDCFVVLENLNCFTLFSEYFIAISLIYMLIAVTLITCSTYGLFLQKAISECISLILFMACFIMLNEDIFITVFNNATHAYTSLNFEMMRNVAGSGLDFTLKNTFYSDIYYTSISMDTFSICTKFLICFFSAIYFLVIADSLKEQKLTSFEYLIILLASVLSLVLMCSSNDLLLTYLLIELFSLSCYVLASFKKTSSYSVDSGIKYFIIGAISSAFFLLGSSFLYGIIGSINFSDFHSLVGWHWTYTDFVQSVYDKGVGFNPFLWNLLFTRYMWDTVIPKLLMKQIYIGNLWTSSFFELGLTLILFSLFIKLALAPFHLWSLDVYEGSPTSSTIFFAVISKLSIFVVLIKLCFFSFYDLKKCWQFYFFFVGIFSVFIGSFGGLKQRKLKTLLAYSSINHMGYVLMILGSASILGIQMFLFYMIIYMISGLCVWSIFLLVRLKHKHKIEKYNKELGDLVLLNKHNAPISFAFALTMFSMAGIPPLAGFIAKLGVFLPLVWQKLYLLALIGILCSVVSTFYYIRIIKILYFENLLVGKLYYPITSAKTIVLTLLIFTLIFLFINPNLLYLYSYKVILMLYDYDF